MKDGNPNEIEWISNPDGQANNPIDGTVGHISFSKEEKAAIRSKMKRENPSLSDDEIDQKISELRGSSELKINKSRLGL